MSAVGDVHFMVRKPSNHVKLKKMRTLPEGLPPSEPIALSPVKAPATEPPASETVSKVLAASGDLPSNGALPKHGDLADDAMLAAELACSAAILEPGAADAAVTAKRLAARATNDERTAQEQTALLNSATPAAGAAAVKDVTVMKTSSPMPTVSGTNAAAEPVMMQDAAAETAVLVFPAPFKGTLAEPAAASTSHFPRLPGRRLPGSNVWGKAPSFSKPSSDSPSNCASTLAFPAAASKASTSTAGSLQTESSTKRRIVPRNDLDLDDGPPSYAELMAEGMTLNNLGYVAKARQAFLDCYKASGYVNACVSAANMALKMGNAELAHDEYLALLTRSGSSFIDKELLEHINEKLAQARKGIVVAQKNKLLTEETYRTKLEQAMVANSLGQFYEARELFFDVFSLKGTIETRLSAANMTMKLGEVHAALAEYEKLDEYRDMLSERGKAILDVKRSEATHAAKQVPPRTTVVREIQVPEKDAFGGTRYAPQLINIAARRLTDDELAAISKILEEARQTVGFSVTPVDATGTVGGSPSTDIDAYLLVVRAVVKLQARVRSRAARTMYQSTKLYISHLRAGKVAKERGSYAEARESFLVAHALSGRAEPAISAANMLLVLGSTDEAHDEYVTLLAVDAERPGYLSETAKTIVRQKVQDVVRTKLEAKQRLKDDVMSTTSEQSSVGSILELPGALIRSASTSWSQITHFFSLGNESNASCSATRKP